MSRFSGAQGKARMRSFREVRRHEAMARQGDFLDEVAKFTAENQDVPMSDARQIVAIRRHTEREYQKENPE